MIARHCEHSKEARCDRCRFPMRVRPVKFIAGKKDWLLLYTGRILQRYITLSDVLKGVGSINDILYGRRYARKFMIMCPNGVKLSLEVARGL